MKATDQKASNRAEVAKYFGVSLKQVSVWVRAGCPCFAIGRAPIGQRGCQPRFYLDKVDFWLRNRHK